MTRYLSKKKEQKKGKKGALTSSFSFQAHPGGDGHMV